MRARIHPAPGMPTDAGIPDWLADANEPRLEPLPDTPLWPRREVMATYTDVSGDHDILVWYGYIPGPDESNIGVIGTSVVGTETGVAHWDDGTTSTVHRRVITDTAVEADTSVSITDMFDRQYQKGPAL
jgi:hypothetical protein